VPNKVETASTNGSDKVVLDYVPVVADAAGAAEEILAAAESTSSGPASVHKAPEPWGLFLRTAKPQEIKERLANEIGDILKKHGLETHCCLAIIATSESIDSYDLDQIFNALNQINPDATKDVVLFLLSRGGEGEPAYQISKLCKSFAQSKFVVVVLSWLSVKWRRGVLR
jgi:ClpP class serine protease